MNFPVLNAVQLTGTHLLVTGSINTEPNKTLRIEFFSSPTADSSGHGGGQKFLGFVIVETGSENSVDFSKSLIVSGLLPGHVVTATATDQFGNTSEFSANLSVL